MFIADGCQAKFASTSGGSELERTAADSPDGCWAMCWVSIYQLYTSLLGKLHLPTESDFVLEG